jgi:tetratricopeptide (TPR) repeat protein
MHFVLVLGVFGQKFNYIYHKAQVNYDTGNYKRAIFYYDSAILINPKNPNTYFNRGLAKVMLALNEEAILDFTTYIAFVPNDGIGYSTRGDVKKLNKDTAGCLRDYDSSLLLNPNSYKTRVNRGKLLGAIDSMELSLRDLNYAYSLDSSKFDGVYYKSITHYYMNQQDSALKYFNKCVMLDSTDARPYFFRSKLKYFNEDFDNALKDINVAIRLNVEVAEYFITRALIYYYNNSEYDDNLAEDDLYTAIKLGSDKAKKLLEELFGDGEEEN